MKNHILKLAIFALSSSLLLTSCIGGEGEIKEEVKVPAKRVERYVAGTDAPLSFSKNGQVQTDQKAMVMPEVPGKITKVQVKVGDKVKKGDLLVTLGESLSTDISELSYKSALDGLQKLDDSKFKTDYAAQKDIESVMMGYYAATESFDNAIRSKDHAEDLYDEQYDSLDDQVDELKDTLRSMRNIPNYNDDPNYVQIKTQYEQLKSQLEQAEIGRDAQEDQLDFAIEMARQQLASSILAVEGVQARYSLQFIQLDSTILQAQTGADISKLQEEAKQIKAPISGVVTSVQAEENSSTGPGQPLLTIENLDTLTVSTSINKEEANLVRVGDKITLENTSETTGKITSISPTLSARTGKIAVEITLDQNSQNSENILAGELVNIVFTPNTQSIFIPLANVTIEDKKYFVKLIDTERQIEKREVTPGEFIGEYVEVLEGLAKGDVLAIAPNTFLREGDKVVYKVKFQ